MQNRYLKPTTDANSDMLSPENPHSRVVASVLRILLGLMEEKFFGTVELKFEAGNLVLLKKSETLKAADICRDNRGSHERSQSS
jgi:hypothetical protein